MRKGIKNKYALVQSFEIYIFHIFLKDDFVVLQGLYTMTLVNLHKLFPATANRQTMHRIKTVTHVSLISSLDVARAELVNELLLIEQQMVYECLVSLHGVGEFVDLLRLVN